MTPEHEELLVQVRGIVEQWRWLPWLLGWHITVEGCPDPADGNWKMRIDSMGYIHCAKILVTPTADIPNPFMPAGEATLDLTTLHELSHLLFESYRTQAYNCGSLNGMIGEHFITVLDTEEELAVWKLARGLAELGRRMHSGALVEDNLLLGPGLRDRGERRPTSLADLAGAWSGAPTGSTD